MAEIRLTKEQQRVVDTRDCNLLVAAAAGSGKTAVLVKRIIKKVTEEKQDIDRLLIVTFTNAAAAEMRERIGAAIEEALEKNPEDAHLQRQMLLLHNAQITTIHSFCLSVIREFFHVLSLDPGFRIGDEAELSLMKADVMEEVLEEFYEREEADFLSFVESFGTVKNDDAVIGYVKRLYDAAMSQPDVNGWMEGLLEGFCLSEEEFIKHPMLVRVMDEVRNCLADCLLIKDCLLALAAEPEGPTAYRDAFLEDEAELFRLSEAATDYVSFAKALSELKFATLSRKKQEASEEKKQLAKNLRDHMKRQLKKLSEDFFYEDPEELWRSIAHMELPMRGLIRVTGKFMRRYEKQKEEKNLLDFNDLEHMALRILVEYDGKGTPVPSAAAKTLSDRYDEIMIDEYQDSNLIQEAVLTSVSGAWRGKPNVFMVGDVKQSIYRFRMACPDLFMQKYETYGDEGKEQKIDLAKNFRSRHGILDAINVLFAGLMHKESTEVEYDAAAALYFGASYPGEKDAHRTEILFVATEQEKEADARNTLEYLDAEGGYSGEAEEADNKTAEDEELSQEEKTLVQAEAFAVAGRIRELLDSDLTIGAEERKVTYGDIVILLRTMSGWSEAFLEVLAGEGIPAYADTSAGYFKSFEIRKALDFLRILDNPKQDLPFAAVLHSPIGGFTAEELARLKIAYGTVSAENKVNRCLYEAARMAAEDAAKTATERVCKKAARFFELYDGLRAEAEYVSIHELIEHFYRYSGFYDVVTVMPGGERRRGNLDMLVVRAKQYEATSFSGLYDFIRYIDRLMKYEVDFGEAGNGDTGQMVRIMSIHKSKGLEFPVVFLCGMEKKLNRMDMRSRLIFHSGLGLGPEYVDTELRVKSPTLLKKIIAKKINEEMIAEELRVLYVAMTRAREKLIMVGAMKQPEKKYASWQEGAAVVGEHGLPSSYVLGANTYYDFICPLLFAKTGGIDREALAAGVQVDVKKDMREERFPDAMFEASFVLRECGAADAEQREEKERLRRTRQELLMVLEQMKTMEPGISKEAVEIRTLLERQGNYVYPYGEDANLPVKMTVSELKRRYLEEEEAAEASFAESEPSEQESTYPEFLKPEKKLSGSDRGTLYHHVMELLPFERKMSRGAISGFLNEMEEQGTLKREQREAISEYKLWKFLQSSLGKRMCTAAAKGTLRREQPFVLGLPAKELYPEADSEEIIMVQGIIDAFFEEEDGLVLMDYKTDYIQEDAKKELIQKYKSQLGYYRTALERLTGKKVKEIWFYAFSKDEEVQME